MEAATDTNIARGQRDFDYAFFGHVGYVISNLARTLWLSMTGARLVPVPANDETGVYFRQVARLSAAFALATDIAMLTLGGSLKRREKLSGRFADVLSQLYLITAALKRYRDDGRPREDLPLLHWSCQDALARAQDAFIGILENFPLKPVAWILCPLIFPWGKPYRRPSDQLGREVAEILLAPSAARDRLTAGIYLTTDTNQAIGRIDSALVDVVAAEAVEKRIAQAVKAGTLAKGDDASLLRDAVKQGVVTQEDAELARRATVSRRDVITVDDFPTDFWTK
jgi:acyl-CoA dehydrogenase